MFINGSFFGSTDALNPNLSHWGFLNNGTPPDGDRSRLYSVYLIDNEGNFSREYHGFSQGHKAFGLEPKNPEQAAILCPSDWKFIVNDCKGIVYEETRNEYPEIEVITPQLNELQSITVNSLSQDFQIQISNTGLAIDSSLSPPIGTINIPPNCRNIYKVNRSLFNPSVNTVHTGSPLQLITQVCSAKCSPPPEIEVICLPPEECPPGTCAVECNGHICCYDRNGISVFSFPK